MKPNEQLFDACRRLNLADVIQSIKDGADVNAMAPCKAGDIMIYEGLNDGQMFSPLALVAMYGRQDPCDAPESDDAIAIAKYLLEKGANCKQCDLQDMGNSPLHWALVTFKKRLAELLVEHDTTIVNLANHPPKGQEFRGENPPLILALKTNARYITLLRRAGLPEIVDHLLNAGAEVNATDHNGQTPLHWAAMLRAPEALFNELIVRGAVYSRNKFGKTPLELYRQSPEKKHLAITTGAKPCSFTEITYHIGSRKHGARYGLFGNQDENDFLDNRDDINDKIINLLAPMDKALKLSEDRAIDTSKINSVDHMGRTELHHAAMYGKVERVRALMMADFDTNKPDSEGKTPLMLVNDLRRKFTYSFFNDNKECEIKPDLDKAWVEIKALLEQGCCQTATCAAAMADQPEVRPERLRFGSGF